MGVAAVLTFAAAEALTQSDGDLFAHIRLGETILSSRHVPTASAFGVMAAGQPMTSPAWLSEVLLALAYRAGGLPCVAVVAALALAAAHGAVAWLLRFKGADALWVLAGTFVSLALGATHWLARPHAFSLLAAALLVVILEQDDARWSLAAVPLMALWANLHGGWVFGLVIMALYLAGDAWDAPDDAAQLSGAGGGVAWRTGSLLGAAAATLLNPYGLQLHRAVIASLLDPSVSGAIDEYLAPSYREPGDLAFLIAVLCTVAIVARARTTMRTAPLLVILATLASALTAGRNIALFSVTGWPLVALFAASQPDWRSESAARREFSQVESHAMVGAWAMPFAIALLALGMVGGRIGTLALVPAEVSASRFPVAAIARLRQAAADQPDAERLFTTWEWGGYLVFAWPGQPAFVDPLKFSRRDVAAYRDVVLTRPGWTRQLDHWQISTVLVPRGTRTDAALASMPTWRQWHADSTSVIYRRVAANGTR